MTAPTDLFATAEAHREAGRLLEAAAYEALLAADPQHPQVLHRLGRLQVDIGRPKAAVTLLKKALELASTLQIHLDLGLAAARMGLYEDAAASFRLAAEDPDLKGRALRELGLALRRLRSQPVEALPVLTEAAALAPGDAEVSMALGMTLIDLGHKQEAEAALRAGLRHAPANVSLRGTLANVLKERARLSEAARELSTILQLVPNDPTPLANLSLVRLTQGEQQEAADLLDRAMRSAPKRLDLFNNRLVTEQHMPGVTARRLLEIHNRYGETVAGILGDRSADRPAPKRRDGLRIGYVGANFGLHPVGRFLSAILPHHDRKRVEVFCYSNRVTDDAVTQFLKAQAVHWRRIIGMPDDAVNQLIRKDGIDILIDMSGHSGGNRLPVFARCPAPLQISWSGYVGTRGLPAIDALIADRFHIPEGEEDCYTERVLRMPNGYVGWTPPDGTSDPAPSPHLKQGHITFGGLHRLEKLNAGTATLWARVLDAVPDSRLFLKTNALSDAPTAEAARRLFEDAGIAADRIHCEGETTLLRHLDAYAQVDIALDPLPYSGGVTTLEAMWMGVPVVTMPGATFAGRHSTSHCTVAGVADLCVAQTEDEYVAKAVALASDSRGLSKLRGALRTMLAASPIMSGRHFVQDLEDLLYDAWEDRLEGRS